MKPEHDRTNHRKLEAWVESWSVVVLVVAVVVVTALTIGRGTVDAVVVRGSVGVGTAAGDVAFPCRSTNGGRTFPYHGHTPHTPQSQYIDYFIIGIGITIVLSSG